MAGSAMRVSVAADGTQGNGGSTDPVYLSDGRTMVFLSAASNLVPGDTNGRSDLFAKDLVTGQVTKLTPDSLTQGIGHFAVSPDGRTIAISNVESQNGAVVGTLRTLDVATGAVTLITTSSVTSDNTIHPTFSPDGTRLLFASSQGDLDYGDTNAGLDVFVKELATGTVTRVSTTASGDQASGGSQRPFFTADGTKVVFTSAAPNLVAGDTNGQIDVFEKTLGTGAVTLLPGTAGYQAAAFAPDDSAILLETTITRRPIQPFDPTVSLTLHDLNTGTPTLLAKADPTFGETYDASFSPDGTKILFTGSATAVGGAQGQSSRALVLEDRATGIMVRLEGSTAANPMFSPDGRHIAFDSADPLVSGDTNGARDIYVRDLFNPIFGQEVTDASGTGGKVFALYEGLLGRAPDPLGLEVNTGYVNGGGSLADLASAMLGSPEGQARSGAATNTAFVTQLYRTTLHREPDAPGLDNWVKFLDAGGSRAEVGVGFSLSTEHLNAIQRQLSQGVIVTDTQTAEAARLYYAVFDRAPDAGGLAGWTNYLKQGGSLAEATNAFLNSSESKAAGTADNTAFVKSLYTNALDRPADAIGLANWVSYLDQGGSRGEVTAAIANSVEAQVHLTGMIENGWFLSA